MERREYMRLYNARKREERISAGLCVNCGAQRKTGSTRCERCLGYEQSARARRRDREQQDPSLAEDRREYYRERARKKASERRALDRCVNCGGDKVAGKKQCQSCLDYYGQKRREYASKRTERERLKRISDRRAVIDHYGGSCACCGEDDLVFLQIDHIYGRGTQHHRDLKGEAICRYIIKNDFPEDEFQILCCNCNWAKYQLGGLDMCPHRTRRGTGGSE